MIKFQLLSQSVQPKIHFHLASLWILGFQAKEGKMVLEVAFHGVHQLFLPYEKMGTTRGHRGYEEGGGESPLPFSTWSCKP